MSERERWIVYPLIFFALGAAVRDKLLQRVETKEVVCESVTIVDLQNPNVPLAELAFQRHDAADPTRLANQVGTLQLANGEGQIVCHLQSDAFVQRVQTRQLQVVDPHDHPLVSIRTEPVHDSGAPHEGSLDTVAHQGVIYLNNEPLGVGMRLAVPQPNPEE